MTTSFRLARQEIIDRAVASGEYRDCENCVGSGEVWTDWGPHYSSGKPCDWCEGEGVVFAGEEDEDGQ